MSSEDSDLWRKSMCSRDEGESQKEVGLVGWGVVWGVRWRGCLEDDAWKQQTSIGADYSQIYY